MQSVAEDAPRAALPVFDCAPRLLRKPRHYDRRDAILCSTLNVYEKSVMQAILKHMGFTRGQERAATVGVARLSLLASVSHDTVNRAIKKLEARGVLRVARHHRKASSYAIIFARLEALRHPKIKDTK